MKTLLSIFDHSGQWSQPYWENGWNVIQWDIKLADFMDINLITDAETALDLFEDVDGILAATPCTEFTKSCAWCWAEKDADGRTAQAIELVRQVERLVDLYTPTDPDYDGTFFWSMENPAGRMARLCGLGPGWFFHPHEFAGYITDVDDCAEQLEMIRRKNGLGVTKEEAALVVRSNRYKKQTGLWGEFNKPIKKPLAPIKCSPQGSFTQRLGGKSDKTKEERSVTPLGFAYAFYEANH